MNPQQVMDRLVLIPTLLSEKNDNYLSLMKLRSKSEGEYNIAVAKKTLELKQDGNSITLIDKLVKGDKVVANFKWKLDVAYGVENACMQSIKDLRSESDSLRSLLTWLRSEKGNG